GDKPMWTVPDRVWDALPNRFADGTLLKAPGSSTVWRMLDGRKAEITDPAGAVWVVPQRVLDAIPRG
ncbi:hypothetical protein, partial [Streptomyces sp. NPDC056069]|uniref:hypothetical protein n=1 Tax=Streptomyces sp. NPDC056069 TaxID=3345702 RepID=UPI0035DC2BE9